MSRRDRPASRAWLPTGEASQWIAEWRDDLSSVVLEAVRRQAGRVAKGDIEGGTAEPDDLTDDELADLARGVEPRGRHHVTVWALTLRRAPTCRDD